MHYICQSVINQFEKSLLTDMDFNLDFFPLIQTTEVLESQAGQHISVFPGYQKPSKFSPKSLMVQEVGLAGQSNGSQGSHKSHCFRE